MTVWVTCLIMLAALCLIMLLCLADIKRNKKYEKKQNRTGFDERQIAAQYKAGTFAGIIVMLYAAAMFIYCTIFENQGLPINPVILPVGAFFFYSTSYNVYCLFTDATQPFHVDIIGLPILLTIFGALDIAFAIWHGNISLSGEGSGELVDLVVGVACLMNGIIGVISYFREKRKNEQE